MNLSPADAQRRALALAARSPLPDPNPRVGCVITDAEGRVLAEGYHRGAGTKHAEADAIANARETGADLSEATAYVTLEPCAHQGRTPSCAKALISSGIACVVYGQADPNGEAAGGATLLLDAGIDVAQDREFGIEGQALNEAWTFSVTHARPKITWKYAATLDGRSAATDGTSQWITGPAARADVHDLRAECGAIVVGAGTVLADNPRLTVRDNDGQIRGQQPLRVVLGERELPSDANIFNDDAETVHLPTRNLDAVLNLARERGIHHVWLEGGPHLAAEFLRAGLIDEIIAYIAPALLGAGVPAVTDFGVTTIDDALRFDLIDATPLVSPDQTDLRLRLRPRATPAESAAPATKEPACSPES